MSGDQGVRVDTDGLALRAAATESIAGVVAGVVTQDGTSVTPDAGTTNTWTFDSDNSTAATKKLKVRIIPALPDYLFFNDSNTAMAQTNLFQYCDIADQDQADTSGPGDASTAQLQIMELDPDKDSDLSKGLFRIVETQIQGVNAAG